MSSVVPAAAWVQHRSSKKVSLLHYRILPEACELQSKTDVRDQPSTSNFGELSNTQRRHRRHCCGALCVLLFFPCCKLDFRVFVTFFSLHARVYVCSPSVFCTCACVVGGLKLCGWGAGSTAAVCDMCCRLNPLSRIRTNFTCTLANFHTLFIFLFTERMQPALHALPLCRDHAFPKPSEEKKQLTNNCVVLRERQTGRQTEKHTRSAVHWH